MDSPLFDHYPPLGHFPHCPHHHCPLSLSRSITFPSLHSPALGHFTNIAIASHYNIPLFGRCHTTRSLFPPGHCLAISLPPTQSLFPHFAINLSCIRSLPNPIRSLSLHRNCLTLSYPPYSVNVSSQPALQTLRPY